MFAGFYGGRAGTKKADVVLIQLPGALSVAAQPVRLGCVEQQGRVGFVFEGLLVGRRCLAVVAKPEFGCGPGVGFLRCLDVTLRKSGCRGHQDSRDGRQYQNPTQYPI